MSWETVKGEAWQTGGAVLRRLGRVLGRTIIGAMPLFLIAATLWLVGVIHPSGQELLGWDAAILVWLVLFIVVLKKMGPGIVRGAGLFVFSLGVIVGAVAAFAISADTINAAIFGFAAVDTSPQELLQGWTLAALGYLCELGLQHLEAGE